jgi:hypothetical protein
MDLRIQAKEGWNEVVAFPGYEVSDQGRVRSWRKSAGVKGQYGGTVSVRRDVPRIMKLTPDKNGYLSVTLYLDTTRKRVHVAHLVLLAFVGPCPPDMEACHNDGNPTNNWLDNLRWGTPLSNAADRDRHGRTSRGSARPAAKLDEEKVADIKRRLRQGKRPRDIAADYHVSQSLISHIKAERLWTHVA